MKNEYPNPMKSYDVLDSAFDYLSRARTAPPAHVTVLGDIEQSTGRHGMHQFADCSIFGSGEPK
jgi:hypothetical protein